MLAEYKTTQRLAAAEKDVHLYVLKIEKKRKERTNERRERTEFKRIKPPELDLDQHTTIQYSSPYTGNPFL
jgi:hypothetical protein